MKTALGFGLALLLVASSPAVGRATSSVPIPVRVVVPQICLVSTPTNLLSGPSGTPELQGSVARCNDDAIAADSISSLSFDGGVYVLTINF